MLTVNDAKSERDCLPFWKRRRWLLAVASVLLPDLLSSLCPFVLNCCRNSHPHSPFLSFLYTPHSLPT